MRINKYLASATGIGRRAADRLIREGRITINGSPATLGQDIASTDLVRFDDRILEAIDHLNDTVSTTIMLHKPTGYVVSRNGQGSRTIYDLLPSKYHHLKPIGRLDKNSSGLLLLSNDGQLAFQLTHPSKQKSKIYEIELNKGLLLSHQKMISKGGVHLEDGVSRLLLEGPLDNEGRRWRIVMHEGRNRQIRRSFQQLGYGVLSLHRIQFGNYRLGVLRSGQIKLC